MSAARALLVLFALTIVATACAGTRVSGVWKDPKYKGPGVRSVLVLAVTAKQDTRMLFEKQMAAALTRAGVDAVVGSDVLPQMDELDRKDIKQAAMDRGCDSVIITHLVGIENKEIHQPPIFDSSMYNNDYTFGAYYASAHDYVMYPGAVYEQTEVRLETNLYDTASEALLWRASSKTIDPKSVGGAIQEITAALVDNLAANRMLSSK